MRPGLVLLVLLAGCSDDGAQPTDVALDAIPEVRVLVTQHVGSEGGRIEAEGMALQIPPGAIPIGSGETITIGVTEPSRPVAGSTPLTPLYVFEPEGLEFEVPVTVTIPVPEDGTGVLWWSTPDGEYELAGFAEDGLAVGSTTHFSSAAVGPPGCPSEDCEGCTDENQPLCECDAKGKSCPPPKRLEKCRRLCLCQEKDGALGQLCMSNPTTYGSLCPANPNLPTSNGGRYLGEHDGDACQGDLWKPQPETLCYCEATTLNGPAPEDLCPMPWTNVATTPGAQTWECRSTLAWGTMQGQELPAPQTPQASAAPDLYGQRATHAYVQAGNVVSCKGHWLDARQTQKKDGGEIVGLVARCDPTPTDVNYKWRGYYGTATDCTEFTWPDGMNIPPQSAEDATRCRLTHDEAAQLAAGRAACGVPARITDAAERATQAAEGNLPKDKRTKYHTLSLLTGTVDGAKKGFVGTNARARPFRAEHPQECPGGVEEKWKQIGFTYVDDKGEQNTNSTSGHAEGDALLQLAELRGREPAVPGGSDIATGPRQGGCAELLVDRSPCASSCAPEGISNAAEAAGLDKVYVRSPAGCVAYTAGGKRGGDKCTGKELCP